MKKSLLLVPLLLSVAACRTVETIPTTQQIQRQAPEGALVRVILRDRLNPQRATVFTVDVHRNEIVSQTNRAPSLTRSSLDSPPAEEGTTSSMQQSPVPSSKTVGTVEVLTTCKPKDESEGCVNVANLNDGDPGGVSGGGGDPTGHEALLGKVLRLASLAYWSTLQVGIPTVTVPRAAPIDRPVGH